MKKIKRNGFTLVELMGVITILGIILLIAIPAVTRFLGNSKDLYLDQTIENIETATQEYLIDHPEGIPIYKSQSNIYTEIPINLLVQERYIEAINNPDTKEVCSEDSFVYVLNKGYNTQENDIQGVNSKLDYDICLNCGTYRGKKFLGNCVNKDNRIYGFVDSEGNKLYSLTLYEETDYTLRLKNFVSNKLMATSSISYFSSNDKVATVSYGKIRPVSSGSTIIRATTSNFYTLYMLVNVTDEPLKVTGMTAWTSAAKTTKVDKITNGITVYVSLNPDSASQTISCSIVDDDDNVVTGFGQVKLLYANSNGNPSELNACEYTRFQYNSPTSIVDPETGEITTHTYLLIKPTHVTEDSAFLKIPIYTE